MHLLEGSWHDIWTLGMCKQTLRVAWYVLRMISLDLQDSDEHRRHGLRG